MASAPRVSVLLPVWNSERWIAQAVESLLGQTFRDFELLALDDGSTDATPGILARYAERDARVRAVSLPHRGLVATLNEGVAQARGELLARMDADDVSRPERLALQVAYLDRHPECVALGAEVLLVDPDGAPIRRGDVPVESAAIEAELLRGRGEALTHPVAMLRSEAVRAAGGYRDVAAEDVDLYLRLAERGRLANLPETLLEYRQHFEKLCVRRACEIRASLEQTVREGRVRRGLTVPDAPLLPPVAAGLPEIEYRRRWIRESIEAGFLATARKHAWAALREEPGSVRSWQYLVRALLGLRLEGVKRWAARHGGRRDVGGMTARRERPA